jgi:hypothetical protein
MSFLNRSNVIQTISTSAQIHCHRMSVEDTAQSCLRKYAYAITVLPVVEMILRVS